MSINALLTDIRGLPTARYALSRLFSVLLGLACHVLGEQFDGQTGKALKTEDLRRENRSSGVA